MECSSLTNITVNANNGNYKSIDGNLYTSDGKTLIQYAVGKTATHFSILDGVTTIGDSAFERCDSLASVTIPDGVTTIGDSAFERCDSLASVTIPDRVTSIGDSAFRECSSLTSVTIPDSVISIGRYAFNGCSQLIKEENGISYVDKWVVDYDTSITTATLKADAKGIADYAFFNCRSLTSITIPESVTTIGAWAFKGCDSLTSVTIPDSVISIGYGGVSGCDSLTNITVDENNGNYKSIDGNLYTSDGKTLIQYAVGKTATHFSIPESVTTIGDWAFASCDSLASVTIPDRVTTIGNYAFRGCPLTSVMFENTTGWKAGETNISSTDLADTATAADCLENRYHYCTWTRSDE